MSASMQGLWISVEPIRVFTHTDADTDTPLRTFADIDTDNNTNNNTEYLQSYRYWYQYWYRPEESYQYQYDNFFANIADVADTYTQINVVYR